MVHCIAIYFAIAVGNKVGAPSDLCITTPQGNLCFVVPAIWSSPSTDDSAMQASLPISSSYLHSI